MQTMELVPALRQTWNCGHRGHPCLSFSSFVFSHFASFHDFPCLNVATGLLLSNVPFCRRKQPEVLERSGMIDIYAGNMKCMSVFWQEMPQSNRQLRRLRTITFHSGIPFPTSVMLCLHI